MRPSKWIIRFWFPSDRLGKDQFWCVPLAPERLCHNKERKKKKNKNQYQTVKWINPFLLNVDSICLHLINLIFNCNYVVIFLSRFFLICLMKYSISNIFTNIFFFKKSNWIILFFPSNTNYPYSKWFFFFANNIDLICFDSNKKKKKIEWKQITYTITI